jgi:hypothetical protein
MQRGGRAARRLREFGDMDLDTTVQRVPDSSPGESSSKRNNLAAVATDDLPTFRCWEEHGKMQRRITRVRITDDGRQALAEGRPASTYPATEISHSDGFARLTEQSKRLCARVYCCGNSCLLRPYEGVIDIVELSPSYAALTDGPA